MKNLGLYSDNRLSWRKPVSRVVSRTYSTLRLLYRFQRYTSPGSAVEILLAEIRASPLKLLSGIVYCPPACGPISLLLDCLSQFCPGYDYTILMGDFNINLETDCPQKRELLDILDIFSLSMIPTVSTHHQPHCQTSTIDFILSSIPDGLRSTTQFGFSGISHHEFVGASFEISLLRQSMTFTQRSFRNIDQPALLAEVAYLPLDSIGRLSDANLKVLRLNSL
jgi:hypothetical protein